MMKKHIYQISRTFGGALAIGMCLAGALVRAEAPRDVAAPLAGALPEATELKPPAFIYREGDSPENRFYPTDWMGDTDTLAVDEYCADSPRSGNECLKIRYAGRGVQRWAGIYWVGPQMNHWGTYPGYIIKGAKKIVFWARGDKGGEKVEFKSGGMRSPGLPFHDSFGPLPWFGKRATLTKEWREYSISLAGADTSSVLGGFCLALNEPWNPDGCIIYLDDIVIVADEIPPPLPARKPAAAEAGDIMVIPAAIAAAQKANVRESWGTDAYQCFTDVDYAAFQRDGSAAKIAKDVLAKPEIQAVIPDLRAMPMEQLAKTTARWRKPLRKTWAQLGRITREGQTDAGQQAELDIANSCVDALLKQCGNPAGKTN